MKGGKEEGGMDGGVEGEGRKEGVVRGGFDTSHMYLAIKSKILTKDEVDECMDAWIKACMHG